MHRIDFAGHGRAVLPVSHHLEQGWRGRGNTGKTEYFVYVLEGSASVMLDAKRNRMEAGSFVYIPPGKDIHFQGSNARLLIFQKVYERLAGTDAPAAMVGQQREVKGKPFLGHEEARLQVLLPGRPGIRPGGEYFHLSTRRDAAVRGNTCDGARPVDAGRTGSLPSRC